MKYHELKSNTGKSKRRVGRGIAAGRGKTAGRGTKGQGARTGFSKKPGFEGGQNPLMQRLPKLPGFRSYREKAENVTLAQLSSLMQKSVDAGVLAENGLISNPYVRVKLLGVGKLDKALNVKLQAASTSAIDAIEAAGGSFEPTPRLAREARQKVNETKPSEKKLAK